MVIYPIGKHVKIRYKTSIRVWWIPDIIEIVGYDFSEGEMLYVISKNLTSPFVKRNDTIHPYFCYSDSECIIMDRKLKLKKLAKID